MERPQPSAKLVEAICGSNQGFISSLHHGLHELPALKSVYPHLDCSELFAFAASAWKGKKVDTARLRELARQGALYPLFSAVYTIGFPWLNKCKQVDNRNKQWVALNPHGGSGLEDRLEAVDDSVRQKLCQQVLDPVHEYVFDCQYQDRKRERGWDNHNLNVMTFQNVYPKSGKIVPAFAAEIARILKTYPRDVASLDSPDIFESLADSGYEPKSAA